MQGMNEMPQTDLVSNTPSETEGLIPPAIDAEVLAPLSPDESRIELLHSEENRLQREWIRAIYNTDWDKAAGIRQAYRNTVDELSFICRRLGLIR